MRYIIAFILIITVKVSFSQNTIKYKQKDAVLFSNLYYFSSNGEFEHFFSTDDMQTWYGKGTYKRSFNKYILQFNKVEPQKPQLKIIQKVNKGLITIKFFNLKQPKEETYIGKFEIKNSIIDTMFSKAENDYLFINDSTYTFNLSNKYFYGLTTIHIPVSIFSSEAYVNVETKDIQLGGEIQIFIDVGKGGLTHYIEPKKEVLKKRGKYLILLSNYKTNEEGNIILERVKEKNTEKYPAR